MGGKPGVTRQAYFLQFELDSSAENKTFRVIPYFVKSRRIVRSVDNALVFALPDIGKIFCIDVNGDFAKCLFCHETKFPEGWR